LTHGIVAAGDVEARHGRFRPLTDALGVSSFRVNQLELPPGAEGPEHDHAADGQEEVYAVIEGSGTLRVDGEEVALRPGVFVFCSPDARRQMLAGEDGLTWIGIGSARPEDRA
jgi:quercetin dioxygenase-like cupin family protein